MKMNLELRALGNGIGKVVKSIASTYVLPSALKVSEWSIGYPYMRGENPTGIAIGGMVASTMITMLGGSIALNIVGRPDLTKYIPLVVSGGILTNVLSGAYEYGKILKKGKRGELTFQE